MNNNQAHFFGKSDQAKPVHDNRRNQSNQGHRDNRRDNWSTPRDAPQLVQRIDESLISEWFLKCSGENLHGTLVTTKNMLHLQEQGRDSLNMLSLFENGARYKF